MTGRDRISYSRWSADEVDYLYENYEKQTAELIAKTLDRTEDSVFAKGERLGIMKRAKSTQRDLDGPWLCPSCSKTKPKEEFNKGRSDRGSTYCKDCTNRKAAEKRR